MKGGLAKIEEVSADTLVAYAAKAGSVSYDGDGVNSPYATALIKHLAEPGLDIRIALGRVRDEVVAMTGGRQEPFIYGSLGGATIPLVPLPPVKKVEPPPPAAVARREPPAAAIAAPNPPAPAPPKAAVAVAPASVPPAPPKPVIAVNPAPANLPPAIKVERRSRRCRRKPRPKPPTPCVRDEQRLARLRSNPTSDEIASFQRDLGCTRLRPQVQRLFESRDRTAARAAPADCSGGAEAGGADPAGPGRGRLCARHRPAGTSARRSEPGSGHQIRAGTGLRADPQPAQAAA